jgi:hypothetical protein
MTNHGTRRAVRVGEVPSSNLGAPITLGNHEQQPRRHRHRDPRRCGRDPVRCLGLRGVDIATTIRYNDTAVAWWRSQTAYSGRARRDSFRPRGRP